jgi:hypothetical protein
MSERMYEEGGMEKKGSASINYYGMIEKDRYGNLAHEDGDAVPGGTIELDVVKSEGSIGEVEPLVDAEGGDNINELDPETTQEALDMGGKELLEKYIENVFKKYGGDVYKAGKFNEAAIGHRVSINLDGTGYTYAIPYSQAEAMKSAIDSGSKVMLESEGVEFSPVTGLDRDYLEDHELGFIRQIKIKDETYAVKFFYLKEEGGRLGGEELLESEKEAESLLKKDLARESELKSEDLLGGAYANSENEEELVDTEDSEVEEDLSDGAQDKEEDGFFGEEITTNPINKNANAETKHTTEDLEVELDSKNEDIELLSKNEDRESEGDIVENNDDYKEDIGIITPKEDKAQVDYKKEVFSVDDKELENELSEAEFNGGSRNAITALQGKGNKNKNLF